MGTKLRIAALTPLYPTREEPYRGAPIWATLRRLAGLADLTVYCSRPVCPGWVRRVLKPRSYLRPPAPPDSTGFPAAVEAVEFFSLPGLSVGYNGGAVQRALARKLGARLPDVLLAYWLYPEGFAAVRAGARAALPVVVGARGSDLKLIDTYPAAVRRQTRQVLREAARVLCVSADMAEMARRQGSAKEAVRAILNGVDTGIFACRDQQVERRALGLDSEARYILYAGRLAELKGIPALLDATARLAAREGNWRLALVGEGMLEASLRKQAETLGIAGRVRFAGPQRAPEVARWMNACDVFCLPSATEGCPNVILEALACGRPVVATAVGGIPEIVTPRCGILVADDEAGRLADALAEAARRHWDRGEIAALWQRGWEQVAQETYETCEQAWRETRGAR